MINLIKIILSGRNPLIIAATVYIIILCLGLGIGKDMLKIFIITSTYLFIPYITIRYINKILTLQLLGAIGIHFIFIILTFIIIMYYMNAVNSTLVIIMLTVLNLFVIYYIIVISIKSFKYIHNCLLKDRITYAGITGLILILGLLVLPDAYYSQAYSLLLSPFMIPNEVKALSDSVPKMFYYTFAIHFSISLDDKLPFSTLHQIIQNNSYLRWQHIAQFTTNKLTELILIGYTISLLTDYINEKRKRTKSEPL